MEKNKIELIKTAIDSNDLLFVKPSERQFLSPLKIGRGKKITEIGKYFNDYLQLLVNTDENVKRNLIQQDGKKTNYILTEGYLDVTSYKDDYSMASLFGITNQKKWDSLFIGGEFQSEKNFPLLVFEPTMNYNNEIASKKDNKMLSNLKNTLGIISQGDQFTIVELRAHQKKRTIEGKEQIVPRYTISGVIDTFKKPNQFLSTNNGIVYTTTNKSKIIQQISTIGPDGSRIYENADMYEIMKNFVLGAFATSNEDYTNKAQKIEHIRRIVSANQETIDAVSSVAFLTSQTTMSTLGMAMGSYYNSHSELLTFSDSSFSNFLTGMALTTKNEKDLKNKLYKFFNVQKDSVQAKIFSEMIASNNNYIQYVQSDYNPEIMVPTINIQNFISGYKNRVSEILNQNASYYLANSKTNDIDINFFNPEYNLSFNAKSFFETNKIGEKRLVEKYQLTNDKINAMFNLFSFDSKEFSLNIGDYRSDFMQSLRKDFENNNNITFRELFNIASNSNMATSEDKLMLINMFKKRFEVEYAKAHGFDSYEKLNASSKYDIKPLDIDVDYIYGLMNNKFTLNTFLGTGKQTANTRGKHLNITQSFMDILGHQNIMGQRASQGGDKFSGAKISLDNGSELDFAKIISSWQNYDQAFQTKVTNANYLKSKKTIDKFYQNTTNNPDYSSNLYTKYGSILYTNTDYSFQDSNITSSLQSMKNISMYDNKNMFVPYDSIDTKTINEFVEKFNLESAGEFYQRLSTFDQSKLTDSNSFEYYFLKRFLGDDNFKKYIDARYDENGNIKDIVSGFNSIGSEIAKIDSVQTIEDKKKLIKAVDTSVGKYNEFLEKYMIESSQNGKTTKIIGDNFLYNGYNTGISGSNYAFIEGFRFESDGIRISTKGLLLNSQGTKSMYDNIKATNQINTSLLTLVSDGYTYVIDSILNEKMTKGKRGFNGTFYGRSLLTMALHGINSNFEGSTDLSPEEKFNRFLSIMKDNSTIEINGKKTNVIDLLGIGMSYKNGSLVIGEYDKVKSEFISRLNNINELGSAQNYLVSSSQKRFEDLLGRIPTANDAEQIGALITGKLYDAYNVYLGQLTSESQKMAKIFFGSENSYLEKSYVETTGGVRNYGINKIHDIDTGGAYRLFSFSHMMKESKAMEVDEALKFTRLTNIVFSENGLNWLAEEMGDAIAGSRSSKPISDISLLPSNVIANLFGDDKAEELLKNFSMNKIDIGNASSSVFTKNGYKFLSKNIIGQQLKYLPAENALDSHFYGQLTGFNDQLKNEISHFYNLLSNKEQAFDLSIDYLVRNLYKNEIKTIMKDSSSYDKKINEVNNLIAGVKGQLKSNFKYLNDGNFSRIDEMYSTNITNNIFGNKIKALNSFFDNNSNQNVLNNFIGIYNQFVVSSSNLLEGDFDKNTFELTREETEMINLYFKNYFRDDRINFGQMLNQYSGEKLVNFMNLENITKNGFMPFKITNFSIDGSGNIVFNSELNAIENIISNNLKLTGLQNAYNNFKGINFVGLDPSGNSWDTIYKKINEYNKNNLEDQLNIDELNNFSSFVAYLDNDKEKKYYDDFIKTLNIFSKKINDKNYDYDSKKKDLDNIIKYIRYSQERITKNYNVYQNESKRIRSFILDRKNIDEFIDNVDFREFNRLVLSNIEFKTSSASNSLVMDKKKNIVSVNVKDFLDKMKINVKDNKFLFTSSSISSSILDSENILTFTNDGMFNSVLGKLIDSKGNIVENVSYKDIANTISDMIGYLEISNDETKNKIATEYIERGKEYVKQLFIDNYLYNTEEDFISGHKGINIYNKMQEAITNTYEYGISRLLTNTVTNISKYSPEQQLLDDVTFYKPRASATIQGAEGTAINYHIKNSFNELLDLDPNSDIYAKKKKEFLQAMTLVFGDFREKRIESYINDRNISGLEKFLNSMSGVIIGTEQQFEKIEKINNTFGQSKFTYGFGSRNPHQYIGSIRASRFVKLDEHDRNLSFLKNFIGNENRIDTRAPAFSFIGKRTALGMNGDFDGDRYQLLKFVLDDFRFSKKDKKTLLNKINLDSEIGYILNDMSSEDLDTIFNTHKKLNQEKEHLLDLIKNRAKLDGVNITNNSDAFKYIEDRYYALKFEYIRAQDGVLDENSQHAVLPSIKDLILKFNNGESMNISRGDFSEFILSLDDESRREFLFKIVNKDDVNQIENIFDLKLADKKLVKKIKEFKKLNSAGQEDSMYSLLNELTNQVLKGNLKFNNQWLADTGYEAYTGIHRTGPVHSALTSFREFSVIASEDSTFNTVIETFLKNNETILGESEIYKKINKVKEVSNKLRYFNTYGTMIEKLSISSKLGGGADPYLNMNQLNKTDRLISNYMDNDSLINMIDFDKIIDVSNKLKIQMNGKEFLYNNKKISSIQDISDIFFKGDIDSELNNVIQQAIAVILNKDFTKQGFNISDLKLDNHTLLSTISNIGLLISKGAITNTLAVKDVKTNSNGVEYVNKKVVDIFGGLRSQINEKGLFYNIIKYFDPNNKNSGLRFETALKSKLTNAINYAISNIGLKRISDIDSELKSITELADELYENNQVISNTLDEIQNSQEIETLINDTNNVEKVVANNISNSQISPDYKDTESNVNNIIENITDSNVNLEKNVEEVKLYEKKYIESQNEIKRLKNDLYTANEEIKNLKDEISNLNVKYNGYDNLTKNNEKLTSKINHIQTSMEETEANIRNKIDQAYQKIEFLKEDLAKEREKNKNISEQLSKTIEKYKQDNSNQTQMIIKLKEQLEKLKEQNENIKKSSKATAKVVEQTTASSSTKTQVAEMLQKNKKALTIGGAIATLGLFFRIFQSNRSVVELDINEKQYEETKGSLYRTLGNYNINTNIKEFY